MSTLKIKTVDEVAIELNSKRLPASGAIHPREIRDAFVADRAAIHTSLIKAVEGLPISKEVLNPNPLSLGDVMISKDRVFTIINSIFKE